MTGISAVDTLCRVVSLPNLDLNLLLSLDALLEQRGVTRAAQQLGLSRPALSPPWPGCAATSATSCSAAPATSTG